MTHATPASQSRGRAFLTFSVVGLLLTLTATRVDDALLVAGLTRATPAEIAATPSTVLTRRQGVSSVQLSVSRSGFDREITEREAFAQARSAPAWSTDPLAGMGAAAWSAPAVHSTFFRQGWPLHAFSASTTGTQPLRGGFLFGDRLNPSVVAFMPLWTGLIGNTLLLGTAAWAFVRGPASLRRLLRKRAGRCENCGYSRVGLAAGVSCPECGR